MGIIAFTPPPGSPWWSEDTTELPTVYPRALAIGRATATAVLPKCPSWCVEGSHANEVKSREPNLCHFGATYEVTLQNGTSSREETDLRMWVQEVEVAPDDPKPGEPPRVYMVMDEGKGYSSDALLTAPQLRELAEKALDMAADMEAAFGKDSTRGQRRRARRLSRAAKTQPVEEVGGNGRDWWLGYNTGMKDGVDKLEEACKGAHIDGYLQALRRAAGEE